MFLSELKDKIVGFVTTNTALVLFIASIGALIAFVTMIYIDTTDKPSNASSPLHSVKTLDPNNTTNSTMTALNALTSQLMTERQLTDELHSKNEKLKQALQNTSIESNNLTAYKAVNDYLSALEKFNNEKDKSSNEKIDTTDYYNKVSPNQNTQNLLQNQINQFMDDKNTEENIYLNSLKVESAIRKNEVRSIRLKKGESIWMLAKRAYGSGFKYHKIMQANPQITEKNAKYLKVGTVIRVPL